METFEELQEYIRELIQERDYYKSEAEKYYEMLDNRERNYD